MTDLERKAEEWTDDYEKLHARGKWNRSDAVHAFLDGSKEGQREAFDCGWNAGCAWMDDTAPHSQPTQDQAFSDYLKREGK
jgi:hypothetical protein